jgi:simple sugar transport system substrate-binding protein
MYTMTLTTLTRRTALLLCAGFCCALLGCDSGEEAADNPTTPGGAGAAPTSDLVVGFAQVGEESSWRSAETKSIQDEAEARGIELKFSEAQGKQENQIRAIRAFIAQDVDAIILAPVVNTGWEQPLKEAQRAGIPVILVDRGVEADESLYATLIASDFTEEGRMAAKFVAEKTGGKGNIVELRGTAGADPAIERQKGFAEVISEHPDLKIIRSQIADFERAKGKEVMEAILKSESGNIDVVYAHNDDMALGAIQAIEEAGRRPGEDILVVSVDGVKGAFEAMKAGKLNASVECNPLLGPMAFDAVEKAVAGEALEKRQIVDDKIYTREEVTDEVIAGRKY